MAIDTGSLYYLIDSSAQIESINGKPLVGGYIEVFYAGTTNKATTYSNFDYTMNPPKVPLRSDGRCVILVDISNTYDYYVYDSFGNLVYSRYNIIPLASNINIKGLTRVYHDGSLSGLGTEAVPLGIKGGGGGLSTVSTSWPIVGDGSSGNPVTINDIIGLAVNETMTAYSAEGTTGPLEVLGVNTDNLCVTSGFEISDGKIVGYKGTAFSAGSDYLPGNNIQINNNVISVTGLNLYATTADLSNKLDTTAFSTVSGDFLTQHQSLANFMPYSGLEYSAGKIVGYKGSAFAGNEFTGVNTDSTLSGNGYNTQLGLAEPIIPIVAGSGINITDQGNSIKIDCTVTAEAGHEYSAGSNIDITNDIISVTGLDNFVTTADISDMATKTWVNNQGYLTAHQDISNKLDTTAFSNVSGTFLTQESLNSYATTADLTAKQDILTFGYNSNDEIITINSSGIAAGSGTFTGVATDSSLSGNGYDTDLGLAKPVVNLVAGSGISITDTITGVKIDCTVPEYDYRAGRNITITNNTIAVTGLNEYAMTGEVAKKLYTTAFSNVSGTFLTQESLEGYATTADLTAKQDTLTFGYNSDDKIISINSSAIAAGSSSSYVPNSALDWHENEIVVLTGVSGYPVSALYAENANYAYGAYTADSAKSATTANYALVASTADISYNSYNSYSAAYCGSSNSGTMLIEGGNFESTNKYLNITVDSAAQTYNINPGTGIMQGTHTFDLSSSDDNKITITFDKPVSGAVRLKMSWGSLICSKSVSNATYVEFVSSDGVSLFNQSHKFYVECLDRAAATKCTVHVYRAELNYIPKGNSYGYALTAEKAVRDDNGRQLTTAYMDVEHLSRNGNTITAWNGFTFGGGSSFTPIIEEI